MRFRGGAVLCLFLLTFWGAGCRKALAPFTDNQAPETWIVAAPQDTITTRDPSNNPIPGLPGKIPVRFHMYWAGSDRDGSVAGYYWAVVETIPIPAPGTISVPSLPGPKARDYRFTTQSDSIFIFTAAEEVSERQHAFYIYAVDNKGRADATPARFIFSSYDRFPPLAIIEELRADGTIYQLLPGGGVAPVQRTYFVRDSFEVSSVHSFPRDTVPGNAVLSIRWRGEPTIPSTVVTGYRYKLDETTFNTADSSVHSAVYNTGVGADHINPGPKIFRLRAIGQSGWRGESTRWFQMNFAPDTWFAGPDPNDVLAGWQPVASGNGWFINLEATGWVGFQGVPGSLLSADSLTVLPALRTERKTFMEVYNNRLWLHEEGDTVHLNSWVIVPSGGFDRDSPYSVKVNVPLLPVPLRNLPVLTPGGPTGSPVGFRVKIVVQDLGGGLTRPSETTTYPVFDPASVFRQEVINGYVGLNAAGRAHAVVRAEDGDGTVDRRVDQRPGDAVGIVNRVENGGATAEDVALRNKILTFYVDKAPAFRRAGFTPTVDQLLPRVNIFQMPAEDVDKLDFTISTKVGGTPSGGPILRRKIAIIGKRAGDPTQDVCFIVPGEFSGTGTNIGPIVIGDSIAAGNITVRVRLCDCVDCDAQPAPSTCPKFSGQESSPSHGRCIDVEIPCRLAAPEPPTLQGGEGTGQPGGPEGSNIDAGPGAGAGTTSVNGSRVNPGPGISLATSRRQQ